MRKVKSSVVGSAMILAMAVACGGLTDDTAPIDGQDDPIIAGFAANGTKLNAVGSLGLVYTDYYGYQIFDPFCSGALIGEQTILSAKHCTDIFYQAGYYGYTVAFGIGWNGYAPSRILEVVDIEQAPGDYGGLVGWGHDVGVFHLSEHVTDITPLKIAQLSDADVGKKFIAIGYGVQDNSYKLGTRRTGNVELRALRGKFYEILFGSFERFKQWFLTGTASGSVGGEGSTPSVLMRTPQVLLDAQAAQGGDSGTAGAPAEEGGSGGTSGSAGRGGSGGSTGGGTAEGGSGGSDDGGEDDWLRYIYDNTLLDEGYEAVVGGAVGDAQPCYGDSGGPLLRRNPAGELEIFGVTSGGISSSRLMCDYGAIYAIFGAGVFEFVEQSRSWVDPCDGLTSRGVCSGDVARRCTNSLEGPRRAIEFDCSLLGETCSVQSDGVVGCGSEYEPE